MTLLLDRVLIALSAALVVGCSISPNDGSGAKPSRPAEMSSLGAGQAEFQKVGEPAESL